MSWKNYDDVLAQLRAGGLDVESAKFEVGTGAPIRCREINGDRERRGWYWLNEIWLDESQPDGSTRKECYIVGSYGVFRGVDSGKQKIRLSRTGVRMSAEQAAAMRARHAENVKRAKAIRVAEQERAAQRAAAAWARYVVSSDKPSDYLKRKGVGAHGVRYSPSGNGTIAIPISDDTGKLWGLQIVRGADRGNKREKENWPKHVAKQRHFHLLGAPRDVILLGEGYATGATAYEATGLPTAVAFDAGNLLPVAQVLHKAYPRAYILVLADDDYLTDGNPGVTAAQAAALAVGGGWVQPDFPADRGGRKLSDFNDLMQYPGGGLHLVRTQIEAALPDVVRKQAATVVPVRRDAVGGSGSCVDAVATMPLDELVERFCFIDDQTGDFVFDTRTSEICRFNKMVRMLPPRVRVDDIKTHPAWKAGAVYIDQIGFDPTEKDPKVVCNTWKGWPTQPKPGRCEKLLELLGYLCSGEAVDDEDSLYRWVLRWLAYPLQHPGAKMHSALVVHGPQGTGKSQFFEAYGRIFGPHGVVLNQGALDDKFNSDWAAGRLFVLADEVAANAEKYHLKNQLKALITGDWVRVNPKNVAAHKERNHMNLVFLSNDSQPVVLENDDRRHCVIYTPAKLPGKFYDEVGAEIEEGGIAALHAHLLGLDLGEFKPWTKPPLTDAKRRLIAIGALPVERFLADWQAGNLQLRGGRGEPLPFCPIGQAQLFPEYLAWCRRENEIRPGPAKQFWGHVANLGWQVTTTKRLRSFREPDTVAWRCCIPSDAAMVESVKIGGHQDDMQQGECEARAAWLARCYFAIEDARAVSIGPDE